MSRRRALLGAKEMFLAAIAGGCASIIGADFDDKYLLADAATSGDSATGGGAPGSDAASATGAQGGAGGAMGGAGGTTGGAGGRGGTGGMNAGGAGGASMPDAATGDGGASGGAGGVPGCPPTGVCTPNTTRTVGCGRCDTGSETQTCGSNCQWQAGTCTGESGCDPGTSARVPCGACLERLDNCNNNCQMETGACNLSTCPADQQCGTNGNCCFGMGHYCIDSAMCCTGYCDPPTSTCL